MKFGVKIVPEKLSCLGGAAAGLGDVTAGPVLNVSTYLGLRPVAVGVTIVGGMLDLIGLLGSSPELPGGPPIGGPLIGGPAIEADTK